MRVVGLLGAVGMVAGCGRLGFERASAPDGGAGMRDGPASGGGSDGGDAPIVLAGAFDRVCTYGSLVVVTDGIASDDTAGNQVATAIRTGCNNGANIAAFSQDTVGTLDATTGRPLLGPTKLVLIGGGNTSQRAMAYLEISDTPITEDTTSSRLRLIVRATGAFALDSAPGTYNATHDVGYIEITGEPISGTWVVSAIGRTANATAAMGLWFDANRATIVTAQGSWFVIDWRDTDATTGPSAGDTFAVVSSG